MRRKYLSTDRDRHGRTRVYFRTGSRKIRMYEPVDSPAFTKRYKELLAGINLPDPPADDTGLRRERHAGGVGFIYFLRVTEAIKIGFSRNPSRRLTALRTGLSAEATSLVCVRGSQMDERTLHSMLALYRKRGEWFSSSPPVIAVMAHAAAHGCIRKDLIRGVINSSEKSHNSNPVSHERENVQ